MNVLKLCTITQIPLQFLRRTFNQNIKKFTFKIKDVVNASPTQENKKIKTPN